MLFDHNSAHTRYPKKRVPEEGKIGRTFTIFDFLTYLLGARPPNYLPMTESELWPPNPHVKYIPGGHPHLPQIIATSKIFCRRGGRSGVRGYKDRTCSSCFLVALLPSSFFLSSFFFLPLWPYPRQWRECGRRSRKIACCFLLTFQLRTWQTQRVREAWPRQMIQHLLF